MHDDVVRCDRPESGTSQSKVKARRSTIMGYRAKPGKCRVCGTGRRKISWTGKCSKCARIAWRKHGKAGNRKSGPDKKKAGMWSKAKQCPCLAATLRDPPDLSAAFNDIVKPGVMTQRWIASRVRAALAIALRGLAVTSIFLIEVFVSVDSEFSEQVAKADGAALRIVFPEDSEEPIQDAPRLLQNMAVNWALDLRLHAARMRLVAYLRKFKIVFGIERYHLHSSPPCTGYSSLCNINKRKAKYTTKRRWGSQRALRAFCRRLHEVFHANTALPLKSRSHEYSAVSRTVIGRVFPFAISHRCPQVVVSACVCGLRFGGKPCCKAFCFESDHSGMVWVLRALSCPGHHDRSYVISESGRKAVQKTSETEKYTPALGLLLQKSCSLRDAIVLDKASIVPSPP